MLNPGSWLTPFCFMWPGSFRAQPLRQVDLTKYFLSTNHLCPGLLFPHREASCIFGKFFLVYWKSSQACIHVENNELMGAVSQINHTLQLHWLQVLACFIDLYLNNCLSLPFRLHHLDVAIAERWLDKRKVISASTWFPTSLPDWLTKGYYHCNF